VALEFPDYPSYLRGAPVFSFVLSLFLFVHTGHQGKVLYYSMHFSIMLSHLSYLYFQDFVYHFVVFFSCVFLWLAIICFAFRVWSAQSPVCRRYCLSPLQEYL
jgi:hypothetical protein